MSIITGYETYIKEPKETGQLDGWGVTTIESIADKNLKAVVTIHRKDRTHHFCLRAEYNEYVQKTKEGNVTKFWQKANTMIKKVAISQGFQLCFSDELGGMPYTSDEMPEKIEDVGHEEVKTDSVLPTCPDTTFGKALMKIQAAKENERAGMVGKMKATYL